MDISVWLAYSDDGNVMGVRRSRKGAIACLIENTLFMMDSAWTDEEKAKVVKDLKENGCAEGFGYVEYAGEMYVEELGE